MPSFPPMHIRAQASRRDFIRVSAGLGTAFLTVGATPGRLRRFLDYPFTLGIASGEPRPDTIVLWTRLAPRPLEAAGGMSSDVVRVDWEIAHDEQFAQVVKRGRAEATATLAHSVHVNVSGLAPDRVYYYRFLAGGDASPVGRTRTAPAAGAAVAAFPFVFASCQHYEQGYYTSLRHIADEDIRLVVHLGDYIYEDGAIANRPRRHGENEIRTLDDYRRRYALYKLDADLQAAHAIAPWIVTWDDHEVDNNYANDHDEHGTPRDTFLRRRAAAYQAYYEHQPLRASAMPRGPDATLYRQLRFGTLLDLHVLDTRQYRTDQPCGDGTKPRCAGALDPKATMMGGTQEKWLQHNLSRSRTRWNALANQVAIAEINDGTVEAPRFGMDRWDGYVAPRKRLIEFLGRHSAANPIVMTGDIHSNWVAELRPDFENANSPVAAIEFIGTSLSSGGDGQDISTFGEHALRNSPHLRFHNNQRGYVRCLVTPERWQADYRVLGYVTRPGAPVTTRASFVVQAGHPGVQPA